MRCLKFLKVLTFMNSHRMTVWQSKTKDRFKIPLGEICGAILVVAVRLIDITRKGEELKNPGTNWRDGAGRSNDARSQGRRINGSHYWNFSFL
jgi:hypothetical protein